MIADLPPGAVAVIFHSVRHAIDDEGYAEMAARMEVLEVSAPQDFRSLAQAHAQQRLQPSLANC